MIVSENLTSYLHSLEPDRSFFLEQMREEAVSMGVPIIRREMESFLETLLQLKQPGNILEIGTGIGYSALFMDSCLKNPRIVTIENYEPRLVHARKYLENRDNIILTEGDAVQILAEYEGTECFDFIFMDAAKGQYISMLPDAVRLLKRNGILLADNVLQEGELIKSRYITPRRQRTIHSRMREFLWEVKHHPSLVTSVITLGDGAALCVKR